MLETEGFLLFMLPKRLLLQVLEARVGATDEAAAGEAVLLDDGEGFSRFVFLAAEIENPVTAVDDFPASADVPHFDGVRVERYAVLAGHVALRRPAVNKQVLEAGVGATDEAGTVHPVVFDDSQRLQRFRSVRAEVEHEVVAIDYRPASVKVFNGNCARVERNAILFN